MSLLIMLLAFGCGVAMAMEYKVGDNNGWTIEAPINCSQWASDKTFFIGDILHFEYQPSKDDVMEVSEEDFQQCNKEKPIGIYRSGSDKILLKRAGYYFFITTASNHCNDGLKLSIKVNNAPPIP
ncbi:mavicyanin-like [Mangifera indica]|uniref:mavicyanin-like n=1 Tax=Mangifera indica TaxID=29780 RepID=UPI001CFAB4FD|nr:mavicyanin-like [Mangifera indica]